LNLYNNFKASSGDRCGTNRLNGGTGDKTRTFARQATNNGIPNIDSPIAGGKDFTGFFDLGRNPFLLDLSHNILGRQAAQNRQQNTAIFPERFRDLATVAMMRDVAACTAGHQNLDAGLVVFLQDEHLFATGCRSASRPKTGCTPTNNDNIPTCLHE
jgi:hypothetical protein